MLLDKLSTNLTRGAQIWRTAWAGAAPPQPSPPPPPDLPAFNSASVKLFSSGCTDFDR